MIRKQLIFKTDKDILLPYSYQHDIQKNLYHYIEISDCKKSRRIHDEGYSVASGHKFKLFNFTLLFENAIFHKDGIKCADKTTIKLLITGKKHIIESIFKGLLETRQLKIGENVLEFVNITNDKKVYFKNIMLYNSFSPIVTSTKDDKLKTQYLSPYEEGYFHNLAENARRKYKIIYNKDYEGELFFDLDDALSVKSKFIKIKAGGVRGYEYNIWIEADKDMQKIIYYLGLGQNSSIGCGCLNFVKGVNPDE